MKKLLLVVCLALTSTLAAEKKVLAFAGSTRSDSYNKKLIEQAAAEIRKMGATVTVIDLKDYPIPFYDGDLEKTKGMPENAKRIRNLMIKSDAIVIATPEYNASIPALVKNVIDWSSRSEAGAPSREAFKGKKFALMSASPGSGGGARGLVHLQEIIEDLGGEVLDREVKVKQAHLAFNDKGSFNNPALALEVQQEVQQLFPENIAKNSK